MHVGVFLEGRPSWSSQWSLPHARGGVSYQSIFFVHSQLSSPCTWGCFIICEEGMKWHQVFPMHVGVFLFGKSTCWRYCCLPHARGGVSFKGNIWLFIYQSS